MLLVAAYGIFQWRSGRLRGRLVAAVTAGVAALWIVPDWNGSGDPLHASHVADLTASSGPAAALHALAGALLTPPAPLILTGLAGLAVTAGRRRDPAVQLAIAVGAWVALLTIVGAVGAVRVAAWARARGPRLRPALAAALVVAALPFVLVRADHSVRELADATDRAELESELTAAVDRTVPGLRFRGGPMLPARLTWMKGAVAWQLDVPLRDVHAVRTPGSSAYLERLSDPDNRPLPLLTARRAVTVTPSARGSVFLDPFAGARLLIPGTEQTVAADGPWRVVKLGGA
jgi:hypothetical protein